MPPPISTTIDPVASEIGSPAPIAASIGSSINWTFLAPAAKAESWMAFLSTGVDPVGTHINTLGFAKALRLWTFLMKCLIISSVTTKSAITPSLKGLTAVIFPGVLPNIVFASSPTASTDFLPFSSIIATTDGSLRTIPSPFTYTKVLAVPKSMAMSDDHIFFSLSINLNIYIPFIFLCSYSSGAVFFLLIIILFNAFK